MALDITQSHVSGTAHLFLGTPGQSEPSNPFATPNAGLWPEIGHTSYDDGFKLTPKLSTTIKKTHQSPGGARTLITDYSVTLSATLEQVDQNTLPLFFGGGAQSDGSLWVPRVPVPIEKAVYLQSFDGTSVLPIYIPRASVLASGDFLLKPGDFAPLPVEITVLDLTTAPGLAHILGAGVTSIVVAPSTKSLSLAGVNTVALQVTATYADGSTANATAPATFTSSAPAVATVTSSGVVTGVTTGNATITATYGGKTATSAITVAA